MPRSGGPGNYVLPSNVPSQQPNQTIRSAWANAFSSDVEQTFNTPTPVAFGGTGGETVSEALDNLEAAGINRAQAFSAGQRSLQETISYASTITLDLEAGNDFYLPSVTGNFLLANPADLSDFIGFKGSLTGAQDATGGRGITYGTAWKPVRSSVKPNLPQAASAFWRIDFHVVTATRIDFALSFVGA